MPVQECELKEHSRTKESEVVFCINNISYKVSASVNISAETSLSTYIREHAHLPGTKVMCNEGGCGACVVAVRRFNHVTSQFDTFAVKSCLVPVLSCHDWLIITVEGLGSKQSGYHKLQVELAKQNGTQCGYCTPGMIMNMYSLLESKPDLTVRDVENSFDGNICRCTGYRPILEAFKRFAQDSSCTDVEDMLQVCSGENGTCDKHCDQRTGLDSCKLKIKEQISIKYDCRELTGKNRFFKIKSTGYVWFVVFLKKEIFDVLNEIGKESYTLVAGNTARGVYKTEKPPLNYIDISRVGELKNCFVDDTRLVLGANMTFTEIITFLQQVASDKPLLYGYTKEIANHIELIASVPIRNIATLGGTLYMKHQHPEFPSDVFVAFETVKAQVKLEYGDGNHETVTLVDFVKKDLTKVLITEAILYPLDSTIHILKTYKIMPRARNTHAYVNAGFLFQVNKQNNYLITGKPNIVYGGINPNFIHAYDTEKFIENAKGKTILDEALLLSALTVLGKEIKPDYVLPDASPEYRGGLAASLLYKCLLNLLSEKVRPEYRSGGESLERPLSSGVQDFETDTKLWPLNKPIPKLEALYQCSGEAQYVNDIPSLPGELYGALVLTNIAKGKLGKVDASEALKIPGVVNFFTAQDIPGRNTFSVVCPDIPEEEPIFCDKDILYNGQAVGIILATSHDTAVQAASKVIVNYSQIDKAALNMRDVIKENDAARIVLQSEIMSAQPKSDVEGSKGTRKITGGSQLHGQYHFTMELQTCLCVPVEDGLDVYACTQWIQSVQDAIAVALNIPVHSINMKVRRLGGGYGAKLSRAALTACACSVASKLLNRPVRVVLTLETNMQVIGKRYPCYTTYEATVDETTGKILHLDAKVFEDAGCSLNDPVVEGTLAMFPSCYDSSNWNIKGYTVRTDNASSAWCRAPGSTEAIATIESIMEHIAIAMSKDPVEVRLANMAGDDNPLPQMTEYWKQHVDYVKRLENIKKFNEENWWRQRGISLVPMSYSLFNAPRYSSMVSIYGYDGTVAVTHGGIECGQGINTKVAQVCAYILGIELHLVQVKPTTNLTSPNNNGTGGSVTSESASYATMMCCKELLKRLEPVRKEMHQGYTWQELIKKANEENVNLNASYMLTTADTKDYKIYGVTVVEVEVDVLTGQYQVVRADILEDAGQSLSPQVDVGQVEGAFVMGLGYYTTENLIYGQDGTLKTNRTWNYYPPSALDIPVDFNVQLRKGAPNPVGVLRSKATGEPPLCMSVAVVFAIHRALDTPRRRTGKQDEYLKFCPPMTPENVFLGCNNETKYYKLFT